MLLSIVKEIMTVSIIHIVVCKVVELFYVRVKYLCPPGALVSPMSYTLTYRDTFVSAIEIEKSR